MKPYRPMSLNRFILQEGADDSDGGLELASLVAQMAFAAKGIAREMRRAALVGMLGLVGEKNPTGDAQKKLDVFANDVVIEAFEESGLVAAIVSEEVEELRHVACTGKARYILCTDPLDGSSNTDINGAVGTIFSFYRRSRTGSCDEIDAELRSGLKLVAAGYVMYGPGTILVYSSGSGVNGFTLDHDIGEFLLSHGGIRCPARGRIYSANLGRYHEWDPNIRRFADYLTERDPDSARPYSLRYVGALVADFHRNLLEGGIYFYPADVKNKAGKLRLLYECAPLAFVINQAGGRASDGRMPILEIRPESIHQRVPLVIGSPEEVSLYERFIAKGHP